VSWTKGDFRGRTALEVEQAKGVDRLLRAIVTEGRRPPREGCAVLIDGQQVGTLTSGNFSPILGHGIALAFLPPHVADGTQVTIDVRGSELAGTIVAAPFVAKKK
jgi:aminomethyltransferase